jgi:maleamate amidohydrolase
MGLKFLEKDERIPYIAETLEIYRRLGLGLTNNSYIKGKRPALLVVDVQETFTSPDSPLGTKGLGQEVAQIINGVVENIRILLDAVRKKGSPIVYITSVFREDGADGGYLGEKAPVLVEFCKRGSKWVEVDKRITPQKSDYRVEKKVSSSLLGTPLIQLLTFNRVDTCIITGLSMSACVRQTAIDAVSHGYYGVVPEECVGDRSIEAGKASLFDIMAKYADVASLEDVLSWVNSLTRYKP